MRRSKLYFAPLLTAAVLLACSSNDERSSAAPPNDAGASTPVTAQAACEHHFRVRFERCQEETVAPETLKSARARYIESCVGALALPGSTRTADELDACAAAVEAEDCSVLADALPACARKTGTLAIGSACNVDAQCQSGNCEVSGAQSGTKGCGVCNEAIPEGEKCKAEGPPCAIGTLCVASPEEIRRGGSPTCKRVSFAGADESCTGSDVQCRSGLVCATLGTGATPMCTPALAPGAECSHDAACGEDAFCGYTTGKCQSRGKTGDACDAQTPCSAGLGCDPTTNKCAPLTFVEPGASCGGNVACREGVCGQGTGAPRCPQIVEDGKGCLVGAHMTCRAPAACIGGMCVLPTTATCR